jgi:ubiquitin-like protein Pup
VAGQDQQRHGSRRAEEAEADELPTAPAQTNAEDVDDLLDEIDAVLEENSEEFVRGFVQKGGQ